MTDDLELLRAANPVRADDKRWPDGPLDFHAERRLEELLGERPRHMSRRLLIGVAAAGLAVAGGLGAVITGTGSSPAAAAPAPLRPDGVSTTVPLERIARTARAVAAHRPTRARRGCHVQEWSLSMETGPGAREPVSLPEERWSRWNADGSGSLLVVATDPRHPGRPVIDGSGLRNRVVTDGEILSRKRYPPGSWGGESMYRMPPPSTPGALRDYLAQRYRGAGSDTEPLLDALSELLTQWTPGTRETAAVVGMLARTRGLRPAGAVTDRLGRRGQAYTFGGRGAPDQRMVILDPGSGKVLGLELSFVKDVKEYRVKAGDVLSYQAWI
ncbi:CU044_5270 family protein [Wenjunlia tyrosinilytica]|uniref:CU044_5270 family protein n=1 Tax=Wenjunlia tyrosinilytica TaxID=1544741 RepID=A0A917ZTI8_9ACTN|nr:CU044_5270 family protein [Wenjunlia tyrosinilytica]GGO94294.1 hypothetical protein GCM10012280_48810 [Wenjunlia tyrosinilytica]